MIRRQMFFGLTLVLLAVVIFLLLRGRGAEKAREAQDIKTTAKVQEAPPSPTRVLTPRELDLVAAKVSFATSPGEEGVKARHDITVRNTGGSSYGSLRLRFEYLDKSGNILENKISVVDKPLPPGGSLHLADMAIDGLSASAMDCRVTIVSADLAM